jgi:hypothetical protein
MAIAYVYSEGIESPFFGLTVSATTGNLGLFAIRWNDPPNTNPCNSVTDDQSNTWVRAGTVRTGDDTLELWYCENMTGSATLGIGANHTGTPSFPYCAYIEFSGVATSSSLDATATGSATGGTVTSGSFTTTTDANQVIVAALQVSNTGTTWTAGSGYTLPAFDAGTTGNVVRFQYKIVAAQQSGVTAAASSSDSTSAKAIVVGTFGDGAGGIGGGSDLGGIITGRLVNRGLLQGRLVA